MLAYRIVTSILVALVLAASLATSHANAAPVELRASVFTSPKHPLIVGGYEPYIAAVEKETAGSITFRTFWGGSLLSGRATLTGLRDGIADLSLIVGPYYPAQLPYLSLVADLSMLGTDGLVQTAASTEFLLSQCAPCIAEAEKWNVVGLGGYATVPFRVISRRPVATLADLKGQKIRSAGSIWGRWLTHMGAVPVTLTPDEMYDAISSGNADGAIQAIGGLRSYSLWDVASNVSLLPLGTFQGAVLFSFNRDKWRLMSTEQRKVLIDNAATGLIGSASRYTEIDKTVRIESVKHKVAYVEPSADLLAEHAKFLEKDIETIAALAREKRDVENPELLIKRFRATIAKWEKLLAPLRDDEAAMAALLHKETLSKLNPARFGM